MQLYFEYSITFWSAIHGHLIFEFVYLQDIFRDYIRQNLVED